MSIIIVDNFQVNLSNPIDNRFVVGSQSITSVPPGLYPTPFYAYRDDIVYKYPGLRIWDFNDNVPYFWNGTQWINENTTGAIVENAATGDTGFMNYLAKFKNNTTLLTKGLVYDTGTHIGIGLTGSSIVPGGVGSFGLHVAGNIKTNGGFVGIGRFITNLWLDTSTDGVLELPRIKTPPVSTGVYLLKNINGGNNTSWDLVSNIVPIPAGINLTANTAGLTSPTTGNIFAGLSPGTSGADEYQFKPILSTGLQIDTNPNDIRIESRPGVNLGSSNPDGEAIYAGLNTDNIHQFKRIKSSSLQVLQDGSNSIKVEIPATFEGTDYYVNNGYDPGYTGLEQLGTRSKPFKDLKTCINKILNRPTSGVTPDTFTASINGGLAYQKWEIRTGPGQPKPSTLNNYLSNLPGYGAVRVIIQSYSEIDENLAINGVTYFLEKQSVSNIVVVSDTYNDPGSSQDGDPFEYLFDMTPLAIGADKGYTTSAKPFQLDYGISCKLEGSGSIGFVDSHKKRKGFFRTRGINSYDLSILAGGTIYNDPNNRVDEPDCSLLVGSDAGYITCNMNRLPATFEASHTDPPIPLTNENGDQIYREGVRMEGYKTTAVPDYGAIQVEGRNMMFGESLFLAGTLVINCSEQHMIYAKDYGTIYSESGRIYMRRNYQKVLYSTIEFVPLIGEQDTLNYVYGDNWYKITSVTSSGTSYTNWKNTNLFRQDTWRDSTGTIVATASLPASLSAGGNFPSGWIGLSVKTTTNYIGAPANTRGRMVRVKKYYRPCNHVYDIYLKNGATFNQGGDFYTQQNTGALQGGPCAFLGIENNITKLGDPTHPAHAEPWAIGQSTTGCSFRATGGGFVTSLFYNYYIKYILDVSYLSERYAYKHDIVIKSLKIDSSPFNNVIGVFKTSGATFPNYQTSATTLTGASIQSWTQSINIGNFKSCYLQDVIPYSTFRTPFSNLTINNGVQGAVNGPGLINVDGGWYGMMSIYGTSIELSTGYMNTSIPIFTSNSDALSAKYPVGGIYLENVTNRIKVVQNL